MENPMDRTVIVARLRVVAEELERQKKEAVDSHAGAQIIGPLGAAARYCRMAIKEIEQ